MARKWFANLMITLALSSCCSLRTGDLLFHVVASDNHITSVTPGNIDHVAIYIGGDSVIEAITHEGVTITPLHTVLHRESGYYIIGRVKGSNRKQSVRNALDYRGRPYDSLYLATNSAIYCTELVQLSFVDRHGRPVFETVPMTFRNATGQIPAYWQELYRRHDMYVPEGQPGTNPAELAKRPVVRLKKAKY